MTTCHRCGEHYVLMDVNHALRICPQCALAIIAELPRTSDGVPIHTGMKLFRINTRDAGKSWYVTPHQVVETKWISGDPCCRVDPDDYAGGRGWYSTRGHNRFFASDARARKACNELTAKREGGNG